MLGDFKVETPDRWRGLTADLTKALQTARMTTRTDLLVQIVEGEKAKHMPIAWHIPLTSDVVLNAEKITDFKLLAKMNAYDLGRAVDMHIVRNSVRSDGETLKETGYDKQTQAVIRMKGVLAHEAAHSRWSHYIMDEWFQTAYPRVAAVITQLEEVRIESNQIDKRPELRAALRVSSNMLLPGKEDMAQLIDAAGAINVPQLALSAALVLGRNDQNILLDFEVREYRWLVEDIVGWDRVQQMRSIWNRFCEVKLGDEERRMIPLAEEWLELFKLDPKGEDSLKGAMIRMPAPPSEGGGSPGGESDDGGEEEGEGSGGGDGDDGESLELPGLLDVLGRLAGEIAEDAESWGECDDNHGSPDMPKDAKEEATKVFKPRTEPPTTTSHGYSRSRYGGKAVSRDPNAKERAQAVKFARELDKIQIRARSMTKIKSIMPPGRLKTRGAVAQAADLAQGRASQATPWQRTNRKHNDSPPLSVGVITDVSGSMGWATEFVASFSWIVSRAVKHINGKTASAVFGSVAEQIQNPTDKFDKVIVRPAVDGSEAFNSACAAVTGMLRLDDRSNGARILFVVTDGCLVAQGEMKAAKAWVELLTKSGCSVIWLSPRLKGGYDGLPVTPKGARGIQVESRKVEGMDPALMSQIMGEIKRSFAG